MPDLSQHPAKSITKMLLLGDSGSGKTGALASLANAGYRLRILDFDNGLDILQSYVKPECFGNVIYETLTDKQKFLPQGTMPDGLPTAFSKGMKLLNNWPDLGPVTTWGEKDILVVDSLSFLSDAAMNFILFLNGRLGDAGTSDGPRPQDYGAAMDRIESLLGMLTSDSIKCNIIVTAHITYIGSSGGDDGKGHPNTLGKKLPPKVARYFNTCVRAKSIGSGSSIRRIIETVSEPNLDLKVTCPLDLPAELPLSTGLVTIFEAMSKRGAVPAKVSEAK